ncbi:MAG: thioredoxin domain-containing protein [Candidatus Krumholzibacteriia bacterium]
MARRNALTLGLVVILALAGPACRGQEQDMESRSASRTAAEVRRTGNHLVGSASLYLRQHAGNPVDWYPWGPEALERARAEDRPIFLSSGYSSCHWCHVMEHEVFEHDDVADALNRDFICIKVDREERPDIDATYMEAVQLMTGSGGWPMSVFLTPDLEPFFGATYIPKARFLALLEQVAALWRDRRADLVAQAGQVAERLQAEPTTAPGRAVSTDLLAAAVKGAVSRYDEEFGGFQGPMKFPVPVRWVFLLDWYRKTGDPEARRLVEGTLEAMADGGLYDHVGGGFHRYTVDPHWTVPHFEKMLYDNAQLARLYLEAGAALDRADFTAVGVDVLEFLARDMTAPGGALCASYDADSGGEEGSYYVWTPAQITAAVGPASGPALAALLGVTEAGNFEHGASVITRRVPPTTVAADFGLSAAAAARLFADHRDELRSARAERTSPTLDHKVVTAWNGLALSAFARGARATGRQDFRECAQTIADYLKRVHHLAAGGLARASNQGQATGEAVLEDHALLAQGLLDLFQVTGDPGTLAWAQQLVGTVQAEFAREGGAWYTTAAGATVPLGRRVDLFDNVIPGGCSVMLDVMLTLAALTGDATAGEAVAGELAAQSALLARAGLEMAGWLDAALRLDGPLHEVVVAGRPGDAAFQALWRTATGSLSPGVVAAPVGADGPSAELLALAPALAGKTAVKGDPAAYVCRFGSCRAPTTNPLHLKDLLEDGWVR